MLKIFYIFHIKILFFAHTKYILYLYHIYQNIYKIFINKSKQYKSKKEIYLKKKIYCNSKIMIIKKRK